MALDILQGRTDHVQPFLMGLDRRNIVFILQISAVEQGCSLGRAGVLGGFGEFAMGHGLIPCAIPVSHDCIQIIYIVIHYGISGNPHSKSLLIL